MRDYSKLPPIQAYVRIDKDPRVRTALSQLLESPWPRSPGGNIVDQNVEVTHPAYIEQLTAAAGAADSFNASAYNFMVLSVLPLEGADVIHLSISYFHITDHSGKYDRQSSLLVSSFVGNEEEQAIARGVIEVANRLLREAKPGKEHCHESV